MHHSIIRRVHSGISRRAKVEAKAFGFVSRLLRELEQKSRVEIVLWELSRLAVEQSRGLELQKVLANAPFAAKA